ncbi:MAG: hypothetical protein GY811_03920 [Myxococcales bacterium]|nr:hypothetical protein [Myxococcales bacterium]
MSLNPLHLVLAASVTLGACVEVEGEEWDDDSSYEALEATGGDEDEYYGGDMVDIVSAATPPPELFVEIISPQDGDSIPAGSTVSAFGGPGWAIPELELHLDGDQVDALEGFNVSFTTDPSLSPGSHTFMVEFTCVLESCNGTRASAEVTVSITGTDDSSEPGDGGDGGGNPGGGGGESEDQEPGDGEPDDDDDPDAPGGTQTYGGAACSAGGAQGSPAAGFLMFAVLMLLGRRRRLRATK